MWTAISDLDGNNFVETQRTFFENTDTTIEFVYDYNIREYNNKVYIFYDKFIYTYHLVNGNIVIDYGTVYFYLSSMDYNGDNYTSTEITNFEYDDALIFGYGNFDFEVYNDYIYMVHYYPKGYGNGYDIKLYSFNINGSGFADTFIYSSNANENIDYGINILFGTNTIYYIFLNYIISENKYYVYLSNSNIDGSNYINLINNIDGNNYIKSYCYSNVLNNIYISLYNKTFIYSINNNLLSFVDDIGGDSNYNNINLITQIDNNYIYRIILSSDKLIDIVKFNINDNTYDNTYSSTMLNGLYSSNYSTYYNSSNYTYYAYYIVSISGVFYFYIGKYTDIPLPLPSPHPWPMNSQNNKNTYASPYSFWNKLSEKWNLQLNTNDSISNLLISKNNILYACLSNGNVIALNSDKTIKWTYEVDEVTYGSYSSASVLDENENIYVGANGKLNAINSDGNLLWSIPLNGGYVLTSALSNNNGTIYICDSKLNTIDYNGNIKWQYEFEDYVSKILLGDNGTIFVSDNNYVVHALNIDGTIKWTYTDTLIDQYSDISLTAIAPNGHIYCIGNPFGDFVGNNILIILNEINGEEIGRYILDISVYAIYMAIDTNGYIYLNYIDYNADNYMGFVVLNYNGELLFNSNILVNKIYQSSNNIVLDNNNTMYWNTKLNNKYCIVTYNYYLNIYEENIFNTENNYNYFSMDKGNTIYTYGSADRIMAFKQFIGLPQVQCRATQIIASANTGKIILSVPIL